MSREQIFFFLRAFLVILRCYPSWALYADDPNVATLNSTSFDYLVTNGSDVWLVEFYAPWCIPCREIVPEYRKTALALKGVVKVGVVNTDENTDVAAQLDVRNHPTCKIFGFNRREPTDCSSERLAEGLVEVAFAEMRRVVARNLESHFSAYVPEKDVVTPLNDENFDVLVMRARQPWLVELYSSTRDMCGSQSDFWKEAAAVMDGKVSFGSLDLERSPEAADRFGIAEHDERCPVVKYFGHDKKSEPIAYDGSKSTEMLIAWTMTMYFDGVPDPHAVEMTGQEIFDRECHETSACVVAFLPHLDDSSATKRHQDLWALNSVARLFKQEDWGWTWSEADAQLDLHECFAEIESYPSLVVADMKSMTYYIYQGSLHTDEVEVFFKSVVAGTGEKYLFKFDQLPLIVSVKPWDGTDAVAAASTVAPDKDEL